MRITRLVLKNWGPHAALDLDMDTPVFGLLGPNASGKSNIMSAIAFGFTGLLDLNQSTYVRESAGEDISNGSVDLYFVKGGVKGRIFRQVGKSPSRKLWWEDWSKPVTKASEIDKLMAQILDCDKKAIDQAVFLSQGHLADFLSGTPTQREEDFARMCLVDHLSLVVDIAGQEAVRLSKTVTDLTSQRDEALMTLEQAENALRTAEGELELHPDRGPQLRWALECRSLLETMSDNEAASQHGLAQLQSAREHLDSILCPEGTTVETAEEDLDKVWHQVQAATEARGQRTNLELERQQRIDRETRLEANRQRLKSTMQLAATLPALQRRVTDLEENARALEAYNRLRAEHSAWEAKKKSCEDSIVKGEELLNDLKDPEAAQQSIERAKSELETLAGERFRLDLAESAQGHVGQCCPLCMGTDLSRLPTGAQLFEMRRQLTETIKSLNDRIAKDTEDLTTRVKYQARLSALKSNLADLERERPAPFEGEPPAPSPEGNLISQLRTELSQLQGQLSLIPKINQEIRDLEASLTEGISEEVYVQRMKTLGELCAAAPRLEQQAATLKTYLKNRSAAAAALAGAERSLETANTRATEARLKVERHLKLKPAALLLTSDTLPEVNAAIVELGNRAAERDRVQGMILANTAALRRAETRVAEIEERARKNAATLTVIGQLEELKNAFGRHGIPRHYLSKVFDVLLSHTQENLSEWETDFQVEKDPDNLFNFKFYRTDAPDTLMDQSQLSGGQRTRLALSFVRAVQHLLYPGLDFLCVDEPSNHLDAEGVEGLVRLFQAIAIQNQTGEAQVIVVDHNPLLQRAFSKSVTLSRLRNN